jgi:RNA polymerase sigma factor (TIGR02999 family)
MTIKKHSASGITEMLRDWSENRSDDSAEALFTLVYDELHRQAHRYLQKERRGHTLQTTALVHEAFLKFARQKAVNWESRSHFFAIASTIMRRILIDYAKTRQRVRRGGAQENIPLDETLTMAVGSDSNFDLLALDEALKKLAGKDRRLEKVVELRFFCGLDVVETAKVMGVSETTVKSDWAIAKAWLQRELMK